MPRLRVLALMALVTIAVLLGGGARSDIVSLMILRPVSIVLLGYGIWCVTWQQVRAYRHLFALAGLVTLLVIVHLIPLPPAIWTALPGRALVAQIDQAAGLGAIWRPLTLSPEDTWNSLQSLAVPLGVLMLGATLTRSEQTRLLPLVVALGALSALIALLQLIGPPTGPLYFYRVTNPGAAVGLFANRNHEAVLLALLFPLLASFAAVGRIPGIARPGIALIALATAAFIIPLIFIAGSRGGLIIAILAIGLGMWVYRSAPREPKEQRPDAAPRNSSSRSRTRHRPRAGKFDVLRSRWAIGGALAGAMLLLSVVTIALGRGEAFQRVLGGQQEQEIRVVKWPIVVDLIHQYSPVGSGIGSFAPVYKSDEPDRLLGRSYFNHAHNDFLEALMTGGVPALLLVFYAVALVVVRAIQLVRGGSRIDVGDRTAARLGLSVIVLLALASIGDYPLRAPSLAALFALAAVWAATPVKRADVAD